MWLIMAVLSSLFAGITSVLAKCGIRKTDSDIATAIRTVVVVIFSWIMVLITGSANIITEISIKSLVFLILSGFATGASWLCYFKALAIGDINKVVPVDKSSTILTVLLAIVLFGETNNLILKLVCTALIGVGIYLMIEKKASTSEATGNTTMSWLPYAVMSAIFAALTSILGKIGIENVESNLGTAIRTIVVLLMAWIVVFIKGKQNEVAQTDHKELVFIALSGIATGASWLCYYYAIQKGVVSIVVPIDKLSIVVSIIFSWVVFKEKLSRKAFVGLALMVVGTLAMAIWG